MNQNWDAEQYTDHFSFVHRYGDDVAGLIDMTGVESMYAQLLEENGFRVTLAQLFDRFTPLEGKDGLADWICMFVNEPFESVADAVKEEIITETVFRLEPYLFKNGVWHADYVHLRMKAIKDHASEYGL